MLALEDAVVLRAKDFDFRATACRRLARTVDLLDLEIVFLVHYREQETRFLQGNTFWEYTGMIGCHRALR